jgi:uncharacterized protein YjbJ (UPF0337 family)
MRHNPRHERHLSGACHSVGNQVGSIEASRNRVSLRICAKAYRRGWCPHADSLDGRGNLTERYGWRAERNEVCIDADQARSSIMRHSGISSMKRRPFAGIRYQERDMSMNKDQVKGRVNEAKGKIKEVAGDLVGNEKLKVKGKVQKTLGKAQAKYGDIKQDVKDAT